MYARVRAHVHACVCACVRVCGALPRRPAMSVLRSSSSAICALMSFIWLEMSFMPPPPTPLLVPVFCSPPDTRAYTTPPPRRPAPARVLRRLMPLLLPVAAFCRAAVAAPTLRAPERMTPARQLATWPTRPPTVEEENEDLGEEAEAEEEAAATPGVNDATAAADIFACGVCV